MTKFQRLLADVAACTLCAPRLPLGPRPVLQADPRAVVLVAGQAPGRRVHETGLPFNDPSGDRLRDWMGIDRTVFYDPSLLAIVPMGFCYPGTGASGDLPPPPECAQAWRARLLAGLPKLRTTLAIGRYAHAYHLPGMKGTLAGTVREWRRFQPAVFPLPHPSPRNNLWLRRNPWFERDVIPALRARIAEILGRTPAAGDSPAS